MLRLFAAVFALCIFLVSCGEQASVETAASDGINTAETEATTTAEVTAEHEKTVYIAESLDEWESISYDGFFTVGDSCYRFINGLVHHDDSASVDDVFTEFLTVRITDYQISRIEGEKTLHFDFTVAESGLAKLPVGTYETELYPDNGPFAPDDARFEIISADTHIPYGDFSDYNEVITYLAAFIAAEKSWDVGDYGSYGKESAAHFPENYLAHLWEGKYTFDEFVTLANDKLGVEFTADDGYIKDNLDADRNISLMGGYGGFACRYDVVDFVKEWNKNRITLQFYADSNGLIESVRVEYTVGNEGEIYGCELIRNSDYAPFGSVYPTYKYKDWEPSYKSDYSDYYFDHNYSGYSALDAKEVTADEFAALDGSYPVYTYKYPAYHGGLLYNADDATLEDSEEKEISDCFFAVDTSKIISDISSECESGIGILKYDVFYSTVDYFGYSLPCYKIYIPRENDEFDVYFYRAMVMASMLCR